MPVTHNFYLDTLKKSPKFNAPMRVADTTLLEPTLRGIVRNILADAYAAGVPMMVFETYRSQTRQEALFQSGATQLQKVGLHGFGLAVDIVKSINGEPSWKGDFSLLGKLAHKYCLAWGGDWPHFRDYCHVQRVSVADQDRVFAGNWYPDDGYALA